MNELKIYDIVLDSECNEMGMLCNSIVQNPAIEDNFYYFDKQEQTTLIKFDSNDLEHKIFGCVIRANYPIYRMDEYGREFYVRFSKEVIKDILLKYSKENLFNLVSIQHNGELLEGITLTEIFIKDSEKGISPKGFEHIEEGSLFVCYKVENEQVWEMIVKNELKGFSIELIADLKPTNEFIETELSKQQPEDETELFIDELLNWLESEDIDFVFADSKKKLIEDSIREKKPIDVKLNDTSKTHQGFAYTLFDVEGNTNLALYNHNKKEWEIINLKDIKSVSINTKSNIVINWSVAQEQKGFDMIQSILRTANNVKETAIQPINFYEDIIMNHKIVMLRYDDESGEGCTTYRQALVCQYGHTCAGNACLRAYTYSGATHTGDENPYPSWRNYLINRLLDIKIAPYFEPVTEAPEGFHADVIIDDDKFVNIYKAKF